MTQHEFSQVKERMRKSAGRAHRELRGCSCRLCSVTPQPWELWLSVHCCCFSCSHPLWKFSVRCFCISIMFILRRIFFAEKLSPAQADWRCFPPRLVVWFLWRKECFNWWSCFLLCSQTESVPVSRAVWLYLRFMELSQTFSLYGQDVKMSRKSSSTGNSISSKTL